MTNESYKESLHSLNPVAVKAGQTEVNAPGHALWGTVTCGICGEKFNIGPNEIHGSRRGEKECVGLLEARLAQDHKDKVSHQINYEFAE